MTIQVCISEPQILVDEGTDPARAGAVKAPAVSGYRQELSRAQGSPGESSGERPGSWASLGRVTHGAPEGSSEGGRRGCRAPPGGQGPEVESPGGQEPEVESPGEQEPEVESPREWQGPEIESPGEQKPEVESPGEAKPEVESPGERGPEVE